MAVTLLLVLIAGADSSAQQVRDAQTGDSAAGVVILEDQRQLRLDATPCNATQNKAIIVFRPPYKKVTLGKVTCNNTAYPSVQVIQN
jgi:hypothetical protein